MRAKAVVGQVGIEQQQLVGHQHAFVDDDLGRQAADVEHRGLLQAAVAPQFVTGPLANHVQLPLEGVARQTVRRGDEQLLDGRLRRGRGRAEVGFHAAHGDAVPAHQPLPLLGDNPFHGSFALLAFVVDGRQEHDSGAVPARLRQFGAQVHLGHFGEEFVRQRGQDPGPVAGRRFATASAPMAHPPQDVVGVQHQLMAALALDMRDNPHAASVFLVGGIVQAVLLRISVHRSQTHFRLDLSVIRQALRTAAVRRRRQHYYSRPTCSGTNLP